MNSGLGANCVMPEIPRDEAERQQAVDDLRLVATPLRLLRFAREAMDFVLKRKAEVEATGRQYWSMRIGIHCGPVVSGVVGVKRMAYDMWGDTVNAAARMEQTSEPGLINLSNSFCDMLAGKISTTARGVIPIKNIGEMEMFFFEQFAGAN